MIESDLESEYIAHCDLNGRIQSVKEHSTAVATLARFFSVPALAELTYAVSLYHDIGKYRQSFQYRIRNPQENIKAEHAVCGAKAFCDVYGQHLASLIARYCIVGHHSGIPNGGTKLDDAESSSVRGRMKHCDLDGVMKDMPSGVVEHELGKPVIDQKSLEAYISEDCEAVEDAVEKIAFLTRYVFSCLTDADSLDTIAATGGETNRSLTADFDRSLDLVKNKFSAFRAVTVLQLTRSLLQTEVFNQIGIDANIYLMNLPTGSGKTLTGLRFALERALRTGKKRIIYVIPYNSIIDQTVETFQNLLGDAAQVLRHQSSFSYQDAEELTEEQKRIAAYASENWDARLIVTTSVQFFESLYANKRGKLRKLHNMADSVIVFDEAHMMPVDYLQPCLQAIGYITSLLNSEAIFMTATMPDFLKLIESCVSSRLKIHNITVDPSLFAPFEKCRYQPIGKLTNDELIQKASASPSSLIICNNRKKARELYRFYNGKGRIYHLSTYMTPVDRKRVIGEIRRALSYINDSYADSAAIPEEEKVIVVSTSLIEAGIDLDFFTVFRELAGLDSILQAGGRCNREGKRESGTVYVYESDDGFNPKGDLALRAEITKGIISEHGDIGSQVSVRDYYDRLYFMNREKIVKNAISNMCSGKIDEIPFEDYARRFELIDSRTVSVVIPQDDESCELVEAVKAGFPNRRKLQKYCATVYEKELEDLIKQHAVSDYGTSVYCLQNPDYYDSEIGITFEGKDIIF